MHLIPVTKKLHLIFKLYFYKRICHLSVIREEYFYKFLKESGLCTTH